MAGLLQQGLRRRGVGIFLTKDERLVFLMIKERRPPTASFSPSRYAKARNGLERKGLICVAREEGHRAVGARLTALGRELYEENPELKNPFDWRLFERVAHWVVTLATAVASVAALCSFLGR